MIFLHLRNSVPFFESYNNAFLTALAARANSLFLGRRQTQIFGIRWSVTRANSDSHRDHERRRTSTNYYRLLCLTHENAVTSAMTSKNIRIHFWRPIQNRGSTYWRFWFCKPTKLHAREGGIASCDRGDEAIGDKQRVNNRRHEALFSSWRIDKDPSIDLSNEKTNCDTSEPNRYGVELWKEIERIDAYKSKTTKWKKNPWIY